MPALPAALAAFAAAQERFERLRARTLLQRNGRVFDLAYANAHDGPCSEAVAAMRAALDAPRRLDLQYTPYGGATITRRLVAGSLPPVAGEPFTWRHVVLTPGAMAALNVVFRAVRRDGARDEAIVVTPCWLDYPLYLANLGYEVRLVPVDAHTLRLDLPAIAAALSADTRLLVLSQPANPTGILYGDDELRALADVLRAAPSPPLLVADECHRDFLFGTRWATPAAHYDATCVVYSFGKAWRIQGQRIGYAAVSPAMPDSMAFAERLTTWCRVLGLCTPTALMQLAVRDLIGRAVPTDEFAARRARAGARLAAAGFDLAPSTATFFLYPRLPDGADDFAYAERLADAGVLVLPAALFHHRGHVRLALTAPDADLDAALAVLAATAARGGA